MNRSLLAILLVLASVSSGARTHVFHAYLTGAQATPPNASTASGHGRFVYDDVSGNLTWTITYTGLGSATFASHIHSPAPRGGEAGVTVDMPGPGGTAGTISSSATISATVAGHILSGNAYFNVHTTNFGNGEIRGQLVRAAPQSDFDGNGGSDIAWHDSSRQAAIWLMNGTTPTDSAVVLGVSQWFALDYGDYNGDGNSDILWINRLDARLAVWLMNGTTAIDSGILFDSTGYTVQRVPVDLNGDGKADIIYCTNENSNCFGWLMDGKVPLQSGPLVGAGSFFHIKGAGDFNGDGKSDLVVQDSATGEIKIAMMDGLAITSWGILFNGAESQYSPRAIVDFDGNGTSDLMLNHGSTGAVAVWLMNGTTVTGSGLVYGGGGGWSGYGAGDFDGDGKADIVFTNTDGSVALWLMDGAAPIAGQLLLGPGSGWQVRKIQDYTGDGRADILWFHVATGRTAMWTMNGFSVTSSAIIYGDGGGGWVPGPNAP